MPSTRIFLSALVAILALLPSPVLGQARTVDVRASVGYTLGLDDTPPYAWVGGGTVTVPRGVHSRFGVEGWYAILFGPYNHPGKAQARLVTALWEYAFSPGQRVNPYAVVGVGVTQHRDWYLDFGPVPDRLAGHPVERIDEPLLTDLHERLDVAPIDRDIQQVGVRGEVVIPQSMVDRLEVPDPLAGLDIDRDDRLREEVVPEPIGPVEVVGGGPGRQVHVPQLVVSRQKTPDVRVPRVPPRLVQPGVGPELVRAVRNGVKVLAQSAPDSSTLTCATVVVSIHTALVGAMPARDTVRMVTPERRAVAIRPTATGGS